MIYPAYSFAFLAEAVILFPASSLTFIKLYQGSKSNFAYLLMAFAFANAFSSIAAFIYNQFPNEIVQ
jgi:hypothetical protein